MGFHRSLQWRHPYQKNEEVAESKVRRLPHQSIYRYQSLISSPFHHVLQIDIAAHSEKVPTITCTSSEVVKDRIWQVGKLLKSK
jgi:hypothetical protein